MTIEKIINGGAAVLEIAGRLDTTTAPQLEAVIDADLSGAESLILDMKALEYISRRRMSCKELERKMLDKGYEEETVAYCVNWLLENRFLNDESYAGAVVRHYAGKGYGPGRIRAELSRRGIERELWDTAMDEFPEDTSKIDKFIASRLTDPEDRDQVRKISAALYRRGHSWEDIRRALRRFSAECED